MRLAAAVLALATICGVAVADPALHQLAVPADAPAEHRFALAVNEPLGWIDAGALALSGYGSIDRHQVIRLNVASWSHGRTVAAADGLAFLLSGADGGAGAFGRYTAASAAWMWFPRRAYDGLSLELGALVSHRDTHDYDDDLSDNSTSITSTTIAGSAMVGWTWLGWDRVFASFQIGASFGREAGTQVRHVEQQMDVTTSLDRFAINPEAFMRFGVVLN